MFWAPVPICGWGTRPQCWLHSAATGTEQVPIFSVVLVCMVCRSSALCKPSNKNWNFQFYVIVTNHLFASPASEGIIESLGSINQIRGRMPSIFPQTYITTNSNIRTSQWNWISFHDPTYLFDYTRNHPFKLYFIILFSLILLGYFCCNITIRERPWSICLS